MLACSINAAGGAETDPNAVPDSIRELLNASGTTPKRGAAAPSVRAYKLLVLAEQSPNRSSRVLLGTELDALGQRKTVVDFKFLDADQRSVRISLDCFARALGALGRGRVRLQDSEASINSGGGHDMGTTRMADDPKHGVTDSHGKVHGVENLFVAGNSLFPTSGFANPTLTLVALTLRLAERLNELLRVATRPSTE